MRTVIAAIVAAGWLMPPAAAAQSPTFSAGADLVVLHAMVTDRRGSPVSGLPPDAFRVFEDDRAQDIRFFVESDAPVSIGLLIDSSGSMFANRERVLAAAASFLETRRPADELFALAFNEHVRPVLPAGVAFTSDARALGAAMAREIGARGRTALYDAIVAGLDHLARSSQYRKVLIVVGDGGDNASRATFDAVLAKARASDTLVYAVALSDSASHGGNPEILRRLAEATGGLVIQPRRVAAVARGFEQIGDDLRSGYTLAYVPPSVTRDGRFRRTRVAIADVPGHRRLKVRARPGYVIATDGARP